MNRPITAAALAASATILLGGCQGLVKRQVTLQTPTTPPAAASGATSAPSPADVAAAKTKACHSFVISAKAMSDSQQAFTERHEFINWGDKQVLGEVSTMTRNFQVWITSLQDDISPALPEDIKSKLEAYVATSNDKMDAYVEEKPSEQLNDILDKDNSALHEAGRACGTEK